MRDISRIDRFTEELSRLWKEKTPDWRFGQLMSNFLGWVATEKKRDIFFPEETEMLTYLIEYFDEIRPSDSLEIYNKLKEKSKKGEI